VILIQEFTEHFLNLTVQKQLFAENPSESKIPSVFFSKKYVTTKHYPLESYVTHVSHRSLQGAPENPRHK